MASEMCERPDVDVQGSHSGNPMTLNCIMHNSNCAKPGRAYAEMQSHLTTYFDITTCTS
jgi:hypothetical protein